MGNSIGNKKEQGNFGLLRLEATLQQVAKGKPNAAENQVQAFINQVNALMNAETLTAQEGQQLINSAQDLLVSI